MPKTPSGDSPEHPDFLASLQTGQNPLVSVIARDNSPGGIMAGRHAKGMAFAIETHEADQVKVLVTCRHVIERVMMNPWSVTLTTSIRQNTAIPVELIGSPIYPPDDEMDLAFLVVADMAKTPKTCFKLTEEDPVNSDLKCNFLCLGF